MEALLPIITQLIAGAAGGNAVGAVLKQQALSVVARTIVGAIGGLGGGFLVQMLGGDAAAAGLIAQAIGGIAGGGVLAGLAGLVVGARKA
ncbi:MULTISPECIES: hypothetical protein [Rhizobium/Agrobacterium group]|jgi:hypothetical protein|uniref:hypothetical protein n=1 Tax=Rhizobium/Agrobacterium group TaxID=227290 RepID=UPI0007151153|nr:MULTISPECIES: hypothetical protein [Rhizobium/Agrobacterium group]KQY34743.1 hypothetical protein ASD32_20285 [Rhizobium sp. Root483D2]